MPDGAERDSMFKGEMVAEYHTYFGSAALMLVPDAHGKIAKKRP